MARDEWLDHVAIPAANVHAIPAESGAREAAALYARELRGVDAFDLVLLGLGEDGHTASLFPGHDWGVHADSPDALAVFKAPKPPPERVSLSAQRLSRARHVLFLIEGAGKRAAVAAWKRGDAIPAASIAPESGVDVLVDAAAASTAGT
jgi:6-phosphogluconolactonase